MKHRSFFRFAIATVLLSTLTAVSSFDSCLARTITRKEYIERYKSIAISQMKETGIPASITLAQGCLESGNGNSTLAVEANNHFGIKCHGWQGATIRHDDDARNECFRKYGSPEESYRDHSDFLRYRDRYANLFNLDPHDYKGWAYGLQKAGYATAPDYGARLIRIIEEEKLYLYDTIDVPPTPMEAARSIVLKPDSSHPLYKVSLNRTILQQNGVSYIIADGADTYRGLAREFNLFRRELLRFNDLKRGKAPEEGSIIYIEKKKKESARHLDKHVVEEGETLYDLSQKYAVQLKYILKYNNFPKGYEPQPGTIIKLRN